MHEIAATVGSASIILIGIIFGIFYNQRALERLESRLDGRLDKIQADLNAFHRSLGQHDKAIGILEKRASAG